MRRVNERKTVKRRKHKERMGKNTSAAEEEKKKNIFNGTKTSANKTIKKTFFLQFLLEAFVFIRLLMVDETLSHIEWLNEKKTKEV